MLSHERIWAAIDELAAAHDLTPSGLAKRAGLDSTTFNKSKRVAADGRARWPSTESLAKIIEATGSSLDTFMSMVDGNTRAVQLPLGQGDMTFIDGFREDSGARAYIAKPLEIPVLGMAQAGGGGYFDDAGFPAGQGWDHVQFPGNEFADHVYALEITGDSMLPLYRDGDVIIVSPTAAIRRGDRVVAKTRGGEVMAKILKRRTSLTIELASANADHEDRQFGVDEIEWLARILWASQ